ncbi:MAG TPA: hypothetical protein VL403_06800 [Candidatus Kryptonia bacterium]|nr:hypothetical protein [Candidatus Kryptonia bacterium]
MLVRFPSVEFFRSLQELMRAQRDRFRQLGYFDTTFGVVVRDPSLPGGAWQGLLSFEVFDCVGIKQADLSTETLDFTLDGSLAVWSEMLRNIRQHGAADTAHTINTLTHFGEGLRCVYDDPDGHDKLYRFAESVQEFFDLAAKLDIEFPAAAGVAAHA